jgi:hypothetical protein
MDAVVSYFSNIVTDFENLATKPNDNQKLTDSKVSSLYLRILGGVAAVSAVTLFVSSVVTLPVSPFTSIAGIAMAGALGALAHDLIKMGDNQRQLNIVQEEGFFAGNNIFEQFKSFGRSVYTVGRAAFYEIESDVPHIFRDTIIFDPFIRLLKA